MKKLRLVLLLTFTVGVEGSAFISTFRPVPRQSQRFNRIEAAVATRHDTRSSPTLKPLVDVPMSRLKLPFLGFGTGSVVVPLKIDGQGPFDFMIDTGLTTELISPHLRQKSNLQITTNVDIEGLAAGGSTGKAEMVELSGATLGENNKNDELKLPLLHAFVQSFAQEQMDKRHPVEGMIGMEVLQLFDVDLDFPAGRMRFWPRGTAVEVAKATGMVEIPTAQIGSLGLQGFRVRSPTGSQQPFLGYIDCGATFSTVNWAAAKLLGFPQKKQAYALSPQVIGVGVDGKPQPMPTRKAQFTFVGEPGKPNDKGVVLDFEAPPSEWQPWKPVRVGIGDLPVFGLLSNDNKEMPSAIIGMDVLSQRRIILETGKDDPKDRHRRMFVSPK